MPSERTLPTSWLRPAFSHPDVRACMTSREGGVSTGAFGTFNPRPGVGDDAACVLENRARMHRWIGRPSRLLEQVHGAEVVVVDDLEGVSPLHMGPAADACLTLKDTQACEIQVADCLPVLFAHRGGQGVAAAHAGWRGLAAGVLEATLTTLAQRVQAAPQDIEFWLGPCIGPDRFEVGVDVLQAFGASPQTPGPSFRAAPESGKWWADLAGLARTRLRALGGVEVVDESHQKPWCTVQDPDRWFSYRRDRVCGRMSALIWLDRAGVSR